MLICTICRFETELDDVALRRGDAGCVCLRCFARETGDTLRMSKALRRDLVAALAQMEPA